MIFRLGKTGLVDNSAYMTCATSTCTIDADLEKCCKPCAAGRYLKNNGDTIQDDYICDACEIGQFSPAGGASECLSSCPAGFGADATIPIYMNVFFMLDMTGSVCEQWVEEVEAAEAYCTLY